jgi:hypothetical protein
MAEIALIYGFFNIEKNVLQNAEAGLLNKRLMLSSSFWCDQIYKYELYDFGHTLLYYLSEAHALAPA